MKVSSILVASIATAAMFFLASGCDRAKDVDVAEDGKSPQAMDLYSLSESGTKAAVAKNKNAVENRDDVDQAAEVVLNNAIAAAKSSDRNLFVHFGAKW